jgi:hypothetical protein
MLLRCHRSHLLRHLHHLALNRKMGSSSRSSQELNYCKMSSELLMTSRPRSHI